MSENTQPSVGQILREAREAQGMSLDDASMRLRLMHRQIEAMETDNFEALGQSVFARGFVRNYARLLGLAPEDLLARMEGAPAEPAAVIRSDPPQPHSWLTSPWLILLLLGLLVVVAVPVALYLWLNSEASEEPSAQVSSVVQSGAAPSSVPPPVAASGAAPVPVAETAAAAPAAAETAEAGGPEKAAGESVLHLEFGGDAWVEIKDATKRVVHRQLNPAGSSVDIHGKPPFDVLIGNAAQARMTYNGRPIDLKPFIDVTVARFTLEE